MAGLVTRHLKNQKGFNHEKHENAALTKKDQTTTLKKNYG